jgi:integrase
MSEPKLLDQVRGAIRLKHYSIRTEDAYVGWIRRYVVFHQMRHPAQMGEEHVRAFLSHLATEDNVAASTQNQALSALLFLYRHVLDRPLGEIVEAVRARRSRKLPVVFTREEVRAILARMDGAPQLAASLLYGSGLRLLECLRLRIKDVDFARGEILVRDGKGSKDRPAVLPMALRKPLRAHLGVGAGSTCSPRRAVPPIHDRGRSGAITWARRCSREPCVPPCARPTSRSTAAATPSGTPSPRTCWRTATTSAPCRSCSGTPTCAPP